MNTCRNFPKYSENKESYAFTIDNANVLKKNVHNCYIPQNLSRFIEMDNQKVWKPFIKRHNFFQIHGNMNI